MHAYRMPAATGIRAVVVNMVLILLSRMGVAMHFFRTVVVLVFVVIVCSH